jgi:hypothetical protein
MNERIKKLAEQAGLLYPQFGPGVDTRHQRKKRETIDKFAQLIIVECMDVFGRDLPEPSIDGRMTDVIDRICNVAEHFGVDNG